MDTTVWITLIGFASLLVTSILAPLLIKRSADTSLAAAKAAERDQDRKDKEEERARQQRNIDEERLRQEKISDKINAAALQAAETAKLLAASQAKQSAEDAERARLLAESNQRIADAAVALSKVTNDKVDLVHGIVNSSFTAALQAELNATTRELMLAQEVVSLKKAAGQDSNGASEKLIAVTKARIVELEASIAERLKQAKAGEAVQLAAAGRANSKTEGKE